MIMWTGFIWLRIGSNAEGFCEHGNESSHFVKFLEVCIVEQLSASQGGLYECCKVQWHPEHLPCVRFEDLTEVSSFQYSGI
jgi:hypothetical protein